MRTPCNNIKTSITVFLFTILISPISSAYYCHKFYAGAIDNKYEIGMFLLSGDDKQIDNSRYFYYSQLETGERLRLESYSDNISMVREIPSSNGYINFFELDTFNDELISGKWVRGSTKEKMPFEAHRVVDKPKKYAVNTFDGHEITTYRLDSDVNAEEMRHEIYISIDDSDLVPLVQGSCFTPYIDPVRATILDEAQNIWSVELRSLSSGTGMHHTRISAIVQVDERAEILAWYSGTSGRGGAHSFSSDSVEHRYQPGRLTITYDNYSRDYGEDEDKGHEYKYIYKHTSEGFELIGVELLRYGFQGEVLGTDNIDIESAPHSLINKGPSFPTGL